MDNIEKFTLWFSRVGKGPYQEGRHKVLPDQHYTFTGELRAFLTHDDNNIVLIQREVKTRRGFMWLIEDDTPSISPTMILKEIVYHNSRDTSERLVQIKSIHNIQNYGN